MKKLLEITNLSKSYYTYDKEIKVLDNISFDLYDNEFLSIVGPSGCGKSTILSIISKLESNYEGNVSVLNNSKIGFMMQDDCLLPFRTVLDNCLLGLEIKGTISEEDKEYVLYLLNTYGLGEFINKYPKSLSGGMKQRVALIRTLAIKPDIILLDEATSALDYQTTLKVSEELYSIIKKEGRTAIMVTHDIPLAISLSDRVIVLSNRPSRLSNIYEIDLLNYKSPIKRRSSSKFTNYYKKIWEDLNNEV